MPDGRQPSEARTSERSLGRCLARCLVLTGGAIAAWLLASGVASAAEPGSAPSPSSTHAADDAAAVLATTGDTVAGLFGVADLVPPNPAPNPAKAESTVPAMPGEVTGLIGTLPEPVQLPGLGELPPLAQLPPLGELPGLDDITGRLPIGQPPAQRPAPHHPDVTPTPITRPALPGHLPVADSLNTQSPASLATERGAQLDPIRVPTLPTDAPASDLPSPAPPGQPAPTHAAGALCAVEPPSGTAATDLRRQLRPSPRGQAPPRAVAAQPGTTPD